MRPVTRIPAFYNFQPSFSVAPFLHHDDAVGDHGFRGFFAGFTFAVVAHPHVAADAAVLVDDRPFDVAIPSPMPSGGKPAALAAAISSGDS